MSSSLFLCVFITALLPSVIISQGFTCDGHVEFFAEPFNNPQRSNLALQVYGSQPAGNVVECARNCYSREFCRFAVYNDLRKICEYSYFKGSCDQRPLVQNYTPINRETAVSCISCLGQLKSAVLTTQLEIIKPTGSPTNDAPKNIITLQRIDPITENTTNSNVSLGSCFLGIRQRVLLGASFTSERGLTLQECKCFCASTWTNNKFESRCQSLVYYEDTHECSLNSEDRSNKTYPFVALAGDSVTYYEVSCSTTAFVNQKICTQETAGRKKPVTFGNDTSVLLSSDKCYSYAENRLLLGMAGALQHQVTLQECKCLCANMGLKTEMVCKSFMYYSAEQDCVLNREDRSSRADLFKKESATLGVTYFQLHCQSESERREYRTSAICRKKSLGNGNQVEFSGDEPVITKSLVEGNSTTAAAGLFAGQIFVAPQIKTLSVS